MNEYSAVKVNRVSRHGITAIYCGRKAGSVVFRDGTKPDRQTRPSENTHALRRSKRLSQ